MKGLLQIKKMMFVDSFDHDYKASPESFQKVLRRERLNERLKNTMGLAKVKKVNARLMSCQGSCNNVLNSHAFGKFVDSTPNFVYSAKK